MYDARPLGWSPPLPVAQVRYVVARDSGRVLCLSDARGRSFNVTYDTAGNLSGVRSPSGLNKADVLAIDYAADGRLVSALLGDSNRLIFSYDPDGTQYVQDRYGALIQRRPTPDGYEVVTENDPAHALRPVLDRFDSLLRNLASPDVQK